MEHCQNEYKVGLIAIKHTMRECLKRPAPHFMFKDLHHMRSMRDCINSVFNSQLESGSQFRIDVTVVRFFAP